MNELAVGDEFLRADGATQVVESIVGRSEADQTLYNFRLSGDRTYLVDSYLTHTEFAAKEWFIYQGYEKPANQLVFSCKNVPLWCNSRTTCNYNASYNCP